MFDGLRPFGLRTKVGTAPNSEHRYLVFLFKPLRELYKISCTCFQLDYCSAFLGILRNQSYIMKLVLSGNFILSENFGFDVDSNHGRAIAGRVP